MSCQLKLGIPFYMFGQAMNPIVRADGSPKFAMISTLARAVVNIIPHFHFPVQMGNDGSGCCKTLLLGITSFLSQISLVASMAAINNMLRKYGALDPIFSQAQYAQIPMAVVGMSAGCIPIIGFHIGAGQSMRVKELFTYLMTAESAVGAAALVLVEFFPDSLSLFLVQQMKASIIWILQ